MVLVVDALGELGEERGGLVGSFGGAGAADGVVLVVNLVLAGELTLEGVLQD